MDGKKIWGVILIIIGTVLMLNRLDVLDINIGNIVSNYWPLVLIVIGGFNLITNPASKTGGIVLIVVGVLLQLRILDYFNIFDYAVFWPAVLILVGIWIIFFKGDRWNTDSKDSLNTIAVFSGANIRNLSQNFRGGSAVVAFGGADIDLRSATIDEEQGAVIDVFIAFGGIDMFVPEGWNVVIKGLPLFGGWDNRTIGRGKDLDKPTLRINSFVIFGGFDVKN